MTKHQKTTKPTDADLKGNPLIGGSKGTTMAGVTPDELEESEVATRLKATWRMIRTAKVELIRQAAGTDSERKAGRCSGL